MGYLVYLASGSPFIAYYSRTEHPRLTRLNPPAGFTSCDWPEVIESGNPATRGLFEPGGVAPEELFYPVRPIPIPVSADGGKSLDWSRPAESNNSVHASVYSGPMVHRE
jgi:hypothetical protein